MIKDYLNDVEKLLGIPENCLSLFTALASGPKLGKDEILVPDLQSLKNLDLYTLNTWGFDPAGRYFTVRCYDPEAMVLNGIDPKGKLCQAVYSFKMQTLPGCCGICVSHGAQTPGAYKSKLHYEVFNRLKGVHKRSMALKVGLATAFRYGTLIAVDKASNPATKKVWVRDGGARIIQQFRNNRTKNALNTYEITLKEE